jgi:type II secretory pathway component GspD/PulD (secretin)
VNRIALCLVSLVCLSAPVLAEETAKQAFEEAFYLEKAERQFAKAAVRYEEILAKHTQERAIVSKAALRLGLCQEKLGQVEAARKSFELVLKSFPEQGAQAKEALKRLGKGSPTQKAPGKKAPPTKKPSAIQALLTRTITLNFDATPLREAINFLRDVTGANIVLDPAVKDFPVSLRLRDIELASILQMLASLNKLSFAVIYDVAVLTTPQLLADMKLQTWPASTGISGALDKAAMKKISSRSLTMNFPHTPIDEALHFLRDITGLNIVVTPEALAHVKNTKAGFVELRVRDISLQTGLRLILITNGLAYRLQGGVVVVDLAAGTIARAKAKAKAKAPKARTVR